MLRAGGGRVTPCRRAVLEILFRASDGGVTAEDLAGQVRSRLPEVNMSTIYRNLEELQRLGILVHAHLGHGPAFYRLAARARAHFVCEGCGAMIEVPIGMFSALAQGAESEFGFSIDPVHFAVSGRCRHCRAL